MRSLIIFLSNLKGAAKGNLSFGFNLEKKLKMEDTGTRDQYPAGSMQTCVRQGGRDNAREYPQQI